MADKTANAADAVNNVDNVTCIDIIPEDKVKIYRAHKTIFSASVSLSSIVLFFYLINKTSDTKNKTCQVPTDSGEPKDFLGVKTALVRAKIFTLMLSLLSVFILVPPLMAYSPIDGEDFSCESQHNDRGPAMMNIVMVLIFLATLAYIYFVPISVYRMKFKNQPQVVGRAEPLAPEPFADDTDNVIDRVGQDVEAVADGNLDNEILITAESVCKPDGINFALSLPAVLSAMTIMLYWHTKEVHFGHMFKDDNKQ